ncbi:MAG TPA: hypothetical protein VKR31_03100 [Rhizomicrobium sp.]|nr:hypothetical protein [Rhizomicrobium sp.]
MSLLEKKEIEKLILSSPSLVRNFDTTLIGTPKSPIRATAFDMTLGAIFLPGKKTGELGGPGRPRTSYVLDEGECAVLRTHEVLSMPSNVGAIGFPPSTELSLSGVLTTNPGHIDPCYEGPLHLTVINMGSDRFPLLRGERIMRVLFFRTSDPDTGARRKVDDPIDELLLDRLSKDFLNVKKRAKVAAGRAVSKGQILVPLITGILSVGAALAVGYFTVVQETRGELKQLQMTQSKLDGEINPSSKTPALKSLESRVRAVEVTLAQKKLH